MPASVRRYHRQSFFRADVALWVQHAVSQINHGFHDHDFSELVVVLGGSGWHASTRGSHPLQRGDVFVIPQGDRHAYRRTRGLRITNVLFDTAQLPVAVAMLSEMPGYQALFALEPAMRKRQGRRARFVLGEPDLTVVCGLLDNLGSELKHRGSGHVCMATGLFMQLVGFLSRRYAQIPDREPRTLTRLGGVLAELESESAEPVTLGGLARAVRVSPSTLGRVFRRTIGVSPIDYVIQLRIRRAADLLTSTDLSIKEVASRTGFTDSNYLARQFRRVRGVSPREYREASSRAKTEVLRYARPQKLKGRA